MSERKKPHWKGAERWPSHSSEGWKADTDVMSWRETLSDKGNPTDTAKPSNHTWRSPSKGGTLVELSLIRATVEENGCAVILVVKTRFNSCLQSEALTALAQPPTQGETFCTQSIREGTVRNRHAERNSLIKAFIQLLCDHKAIKQAHIITGHTWPLRNTHTHSVEKQLDAMQLEAQ